MDAKHFERIKDACQAVIARGQDELEEALFDVCAGDEEFMREVRPKVEEYFDSLSTGRTNPPNDSNQHQSQRVFADRFRVLSWLGAGAFGHVYRVWDEKLKSEYALKVLKARFPEGKALFNFKSEFRTLTGLSKHPNIVKLYELIDDHGDLMFIMDFVDGVDFRRFLKNQPGEERERQLRICIKEIAEGLQWLHSQNLLHRDLKPSNILVKKSTGRPVLLDFGLARLLEDDGDASTTIAGTPAYMSPEQAQKGAVLHHASDWYAVGVMLYEALTDAVPFQGSNPLARKQLEDPEPPITRAPHVSADLNELCIKLLNRNPLERGSYNDVITLLSSGDRHIQAARSPMVSRLMPRPVLVGRSKPLREMNDAYSQAENRSVLVDLRGPSGIGKTRLIQEFLTPLKRDSGVVIFEGRCYQGESVPYHAVDDLIDHIYIHLRRMPREEVERLLPRNFAALVKVFPVLRQFLPADTRPLIDFDSTRVRMRAFGALREMLGRFAERRRVVVVIDDLQWGDAEGHAVLNDLVSSGDTPPMLVVLSYRPEDIHRNSFLATLREPRKPPSNRTVVPIDLDQLEINEVGEMVRLLVNRSVSTTDLSRIFEESGGNPFLVQEIVRWILVRGVDRALGSRFSLRDVVHSRAGNLSQESRRLLESIAVAGQPTELSVLRMAGQIGDVLAARAELVDARFARVIERDRERDEVEIYHDRIRATIVDDLKPEVKSARHQELARALEVAGDGDPERLQAHFELAGDLYSSCKYALLAARRASGVLAFQKASVYFEKALKTHALEERETRLVRRERADALASAGLGKDAADQYLEACKGAPADEQLAWKQRAAEELLHSGRVDEGLPIFEEVLGRVGTRLPRPTSRWPLDLLVRRARLKIRGLRWRERSASSVPRDLLLRLDTCASVSTGLALIDVARGASLQTTSLLLALQAGEPGRIARALAMEAGYRSTVGIRAKGSAEELIKLARELSDRTGDPRARGQTAVMWATCAWSFGDWKECRERAREARDILREIARERPERLTWERDTAAIFEIEGLRWMGKWSEMKAILPEFLEDAKLRGDLYAEALLQMHGGSCVLLANNEPLQARNNLEDVLKRWTNAGFHVEHLVETHNQIEIDLYLGDGRKAFELINQRWRRLRDSLLLRVQNFKIEMRSLRARACLAAALDERSRSTRRELLSMAQREARRIRREATLQAITLSELIAGSAEAQLGRTEPALAAFQRAETAAISGGMLLHSAAARRSQGVLVGGQSGQERRAAAEDEFKSEGIVRPERMCAVMVPGLDSESLGLIPE